MGSVLTHPIMAPERDTGAQQLPVGTEKDPVLVDRVFSVGDPSGIRTRVTAVRGQRTRPLYDGAVTVAQPSCCDAFPIGQPQ
ncbi:hypothetical protein CITRIK5_20558 [Citricoccus sp. K5]|nr:hypothetical protein CITRIK5_20558 [Citricoccus sp. K5]